jgi:hypothetical protein
MLNVIMLSVIMVNVIVLSVIMLSVVKPFIYLQKGQTAKSGHSIFEQSLYACVAHSVSCLRSHFCTRTSHVRHSRHPMRDAADE